MSAQNASSADALFGPEPVHTLTALKVRVPRKFEDILLCLGARITGTTPAVIISSRKASSSLEFYVPSRHARAVSTKLSVYFKKTFGKNLTIQKFIPKPPSQGRRFSPLPGITITPFRASLPQRIPKESIILDSSQAFGTGRHPTTLLALDAIRKHADIIGSLLDIGTGTGILAIAAAKVFHVPQVWGIENDRNAYRIAKHHAAVNGQRKQLRIVHEDIKNCSVPRCDFVVANLTASIILNNLSYTIRRVKPGGLLFFTGILRRECLAFRKAVLKRSHLKLLRTVYKKEWAGILFQTR